ncbi:MAG TPA: CoA-binding protein [Terriglobales bacterium]|nr:CoA-binding protein [Terriglobales bacterium]
MGKPNVSLNAIDNFFAQKRIAFVGMPRERSRETSLLFDLLEEFSRRGYDVMPVNPKAAEILGRRCFSRVQDIQPAPDAALLLTSPAVTNTVVRDCTEAGIKYIWMYRGGGQGAVTPEAVEFCRSHGMEVIPGQCPFMFLQPVRSFHRFHRFLFKIMGNYPKHTKVAQIF